MLTRPLLFACLAALTTAAAPARPSGSAYRDILERYERGDATAVTDLASLNSDARESGRRALIQEFDQSGTLSSRAARLLRTAIVAHTDAAITARIGTTPIPWSPHLSAAEVYAQRIASKKQDDALVLHWWIVAAGAMHAQRNYTQAIEAIKHARHACGDRAEFLFAYGVTHELAWMWEHEEDFRVPFHPSLAEAESAYTKAIALQPALVEARVRLARVRALRGDAASAARMLARVDESAGPALSYLARLFEGDALERQGNVEDAARRYDQAAHLVPQAQSAQLALAFVRYQQGERADAAGRMHAAAADRRAADDGDPWFWYSLGLAWLVRPELVEMRRLVRR